MRIPGADKAIDNLIKWSANEEWNPFREQVFAEHFDMIFDRFDTTKEEIADLLGDSFGMVFGCVLEDFFTARFGDKGDNIIDDYLKRRGVAGENLGKTLPGGHQGLCFVALRGR